MRYVIIRDDDTNALTPVECLEKLYRPFLDRSLPVNLAVIPNVATDTTRPGGEPEGYLLAKNGHSEKTVPIASNSKLVRYLRQNSGYRIVQHGFRHDYFEFDRRSSADVEHRLDEGSRLLIQAGFARPTTFVAPYDKLSQTSLRAVSRRFNVLSTGWFEWRRLPITWRAGYVLKKLRRVPHWRVGKTILLTHPGCLLSCHRDYDSMLAEVIRSVQSRRLTVLVTHWWEYFRDGREDESFIGILRETADYLAAQPDIQVLSFSDLTPNDILANPQAAEENSPTPSLSHPRGEGARRAGEGEQAGNPAN